MASIARLCASREDYSSVLSGCCQPRVVMAAAARSQRAVSKVTPGLDTGGYRHFHPEIEIVTGRDSLEESVTVVIDRARKKLPEIIVSGSRTKEVRDHSATDGRRKGGVLNKASLAKLTSEEAVHVAVRRFVAFASACRGARIPAMASCLRIGRRSRPSMAWNCRADKGASG